MSVIEEVLKEEVKRLEGTILFYLKKLKLIPRGTIYVQKIKGNYFVYRKRKVKGKVISEYIGKEDSEQSKKALENAKEYKRIKNNIRIAKSELYKLRGVYRIYKQ